jgi:hypothetical protein
MPTNDTEAKYRILLAIMSRQDERAKARREKKIAQRQPAPLKKAA